MGIGNGRQTNPNTDFDDSQQGSSVDPSPSNVAVPNTQFNVCDDSQQGACVEESSSSNVAVPNIQANDPEQSETSCLQESVNFYRIITLVVDFGTDVLLKTFYFYKPKKEVKDFLASDSVKKKFKEMKKLRILTTPQYKLVMSDTNPDHYDISLLSTLLRNVIPNVSPPSKGWETHPADDDVSLSADMLRLKEIRNVIIAHILKAQMNETGFNNLWSQVTKILKRMMAQVIKQDEERSTMEKKMDELKSKVLDVTDHEQRLLNKLKAWFDDDRNQIMHQIKSLEEKIGDPAQTLDIQSLKEVVCSGFNIQEEDIIKIIQQLEGVHLGNITIQIELNGIRKLLEDMLPSVQTFGNQHATLDAPMDVQTEQNLSIISQYIGSSWECLAPFLSISHTTVEHIKADHKESTQQQVYNMLLKWQKTEECHASMTSLFEQMHKATGVSIDWIRLRELFGPVVDNVQTRTDASQEGLTQRLKANVQVQSSELPSLNLEQKLADQTPVNTPPYFSQPSVETDCGEISNPIQTTGCRMQDFVILYADADINEVYTYKEHFLQNFRDLLPPIEIEMFDDIDTNRTNIDSLSMLHDKFHYILLYVTKNLATDRIQKYWNQLVIYTGVIDEEKKERVIPVWAIDEEGKKVIPTEIRLIKGFKYTHFSNNIYLQKNFKQTVKTLVEKARKK